MLTKFEMDLKIVEVTRYILQVYVSTLYKFKVIVHAV